MATSGSGQEFLQLLVVDMWRVAPQVQDPRFPVQVLAESRAQFLRQDALLGFRYCEDLALDMEDKVGEKYLPEYLG